MFADEFGCTTIFINSLERQLLLHNEDCDPLVKACGYLLTARVEEEGEGQGEQFTSFCYPGTLPGLAFSVNQHGLAFTCNTLCPGEIAGLVVCPSTRTFLHRHTHTHTRTHTHARM